MILCSRDGLVWWTPLRFSELMKMVGNGNAVEVQNSEVALVSSFPFFLGAREGTACSASVKSLNRASLNSWHKCDTSECAGCRTRDLFDHVFFCF